MQFIAFLLVGATSAVGSLATRYLANAVMPFEAAVIVAHVAGMLCAFSLDRCFVFAVTSQRQWPSQLGRFAIVNVLSLITATAVSSLAFRSVLPLVGIHVHADFVAHFLGLAACSVPSFLGHKYFSFR